MLPHDSGDGVINSTISAAQRFSNDFTSLITNIATNLKQGADTLWDSGKGFQFHQNITYADFYGTSHTTVFDFNSLFGSNGQINSQTVAGPAVDGYLTTQWEKTVTLNNGGPHAGSYYSTDVKLVGYNPV